ncbi:MAG: GtrA family protein [Clostridiales bacterium]|nr:GtrA family protein [Clostridiales bacterium]
MNKIRELLEKYWELISYAFWGVMTTLVNYVVYFICTKAIGIDYLIANVIAWFVAVVFAFWVNKVYVFRSYQKDAKTMVREFGTFVSARILSGILETGMLALFVEAMHFNDSVIKIIASVLVVIINYVLSKLIIFKKQEEKA